MGGDGGWVGPTCFLLVSPHFFDILIYIFFIIILIERKMMIMLSENEKLPHPTTTPVCDCLDPASIRCFAVLVDLFPTVITSMPFSSLPTFFFGPKEDFNCISLI